VVRVRHIPSEIPKIILSTRSNSSHIHVGQALLAWHADRTMVAAIRGTVRSDTHPRVRIAAMNDDVTFWFNELADGSELAAQANVA
jgi:hypothetical protein